MAPYRGRGRGRGGSRGGTVSRGGGKLARSGIRTRAGYKRFDSQRVKDVASESGDEVPEAEGPGADEDEEDLSDEEEVETLPKVKAYSALLQLFQQPVVLEKRHKRLKIESETAPELELENGIDDDDDGKIDGREDEASDDEATGGLNGSLNPDLDDVKGEEDETDPFGVHFANADNDELSKRLESIQMKDWRTEKDNAAGIGALTVSVPKSVQGNVIRKAVIKNTADLTLKKRLGETSARHIPTFDELQQAVAPYIFNYSDVLLGNRTPQNADSLRSVACLHALNHVLKGRDRVLKNTARLAQAEHPDSLDLRDQGFTRPKVLILTETRQIASKYADTIVELFSPEQQENKQRFKDSFTAPFDDRETMPEDYSELFGGNNDNSFLTALKFTRKTLKFYSAFYSSDIILASPLGLRRIIEHEDAKKRDYDFLSSIEVAIVDQADAMQMQNWENVEIVFKHLDLEVKDSHGADFSRIRNWYLDGHAKYLRQTIIFSAYITPEMNNLFNSSMLNIAGKAKFTPLYPGAITETGGLGIKQTFSRFNAVSPAADPDARFKYFTTAILPTLLRLPKPADGAHGILVFVPSYYDFLRVRNFFATSTLTANVSFGAIHDYSEVRDQRRARSHFLSGRHTILLYTQRAHHFFRLRIRGVKRVVMYGLPEPEVFYRELVAGFLGTSLGEGRQAPEECGVRCLFSKWDGLRLARVVGGSRVKGMLGGVGDTFDFV